MSQPNCNPASYASARDARASYASARDAQASEVAAASSDKEPFDFDQLVCLAGRFAALSYLDDRVTERTRASLRAQYYLDYPEVRCLQDFVQLLDDRER